MVGSFVVLFEFARLHEKHYLIHLASGTGICAWLPLATGAEVVSQGEPPCTGALTTITSCPWFCSMVGILLWCFFHNYLCPWFISMVGSFVVVFEFVRLHELMDLVLVFCI